MSIAGEIKQIATRFAVGLHQRATQLQTELAEVEARKAALQTELDAARLSQQRLMNFEPQIGRDFQCPRCWVQHEKRSVLSPDWGRDGARGLLALPYLQF